MKKIYTRPVLARHGGATERTKGRIWGWYWDYFDGYRAYPDR